MYYDIMTKDGVQENEEEVEVKYMGKEQLCWSCKKAAGGCSWSDSLRPVKGWVADAVEYKSQETGSKERTWAIHSCPKYEPESICMRCKYFKGTEEESIGYNKICSHSSVGYSLSSCSQCQNKYEIALMKSMW